MRIYIAMNVNMPGDEENCQVVPVSTLVAHMAGDVPCDDNDAGSSDEVQLLSLFETLHAFVIVKQETAGKGQLSD